MEVARTTEFLQKSRPALLDLWGKAKKHYTPHQPSQAARIIGWLGDSKNRTIIQQAPMNPKICQRRFRKVIQG
jgi:hypothetical protein